MTIAALINQSQNDHEAWRYTSLAPYAAVTLGKAATQTPNLPKAITRHRLVFVDGVYRENLSARQELPDEFFSLCDEGENCCALSLFGQTCLAVDPIELLFVSTAQAADNEAVTKIKVSLGASSRMTLIERHIDAGGNINARHIQMEIDLDAQSKLVHGKIVSGGDATLHIAQTKVMAQAGAFYDHFSMICSGKLVRCEQDVALVGEMAEARLLGAMLLDDDHHGDCTSLVRHLAPHGTSRQICKTVLNDRACCVFQGKVFVAQEAQKTDGYQLCRALLLSDKAEMDAKPELEIYADDVKCSHGTAIGDLDETALFYLRSRGIGEDEARSLLVQAFIGELIDQIQAPELAALVRQEVEAWLA